MKRSKRNHVNILCLAIIIAVLPLLSSCGEDDGPSTTDLLIGDWELERFNGDKISKSEFRLNIEVESNGDYTERLFLEDFGSSVNRGEWKLVGQTIEIEYDDGSELEFEIKRLTSEEMELEDQVDEDEWEFEKES